MKGSRTALFALLLTVLGALQGFDWITLVDDPSVVGWIGTGIGVAVFALRSITSTPLFQDGE